MTGIPRTGDQAEQHKTFGLNGSGRIIFIAIFERLEQKCTVLIQNLKRFEFFKLKAFILQGGRREAPDQSCEMYVASSLHH